MTLRSGEVLEIHDDLIAKAFKEFGASIARKWNLLTSVLGLLNEVDPILRYVASGDDYVKQVPAPETKAKEALKELDAVFERIEQERNLG